MKRYYDLKTNTDNNFGDEIDQSYMVEIPNDGKPYGLIDGKVVDILETQDYKNKIATEKEKEFFNNFIEISIGCLRKSPKGYSSIVEAMNSALNVIYINQSLPAGALTIYPKPDFKTVDDVEKYLEENSYKNKAMTSKEFGALYVEFMNKWNSQEHIS